MNSYCASITEQTTAKCYVYVKKDDDEMQLDSCMELITISKTRNPRIVQSSGSRIV